jgi:hypothetical protein
MEESSWWKRNEMAALFLIIILINIAGSLQYDLLLISSVSYNLFHRIPCVDN